ncbi:MAG: hypothetical protein FJ298_02710 [Planctomycetes bacterium]|nr:hypothetical protein [Planctomycetota bacterium]
MRKLLIFAWLLLPVGAAAYHYGPGQERLREDAAAEQVALARAHVHQACEVAAKEGDAAARGLWSEAERTLSEAIEALPAEHVGELRRLRLERAKARMFISKLPDARSELESLLGELEADAGADSALVLDTRDALANAQYYTTWLLRLEGAAPEEWEREIDASRQNYKLVAETLAARNDADGAARAQESLESSIRLARMDIKDLQGLPLPSQ